MIFRHFKEFQSREAVAVSPRETLNICVLPRRETRSGPSSTRNSRRALEKWETQKFAPVGSLSFFLHSALLSRRATMTNNEARPEGFREKNGCLLCCWGNMDTIVLLFRFVPILFSLSFSPCFSTFPFALASHLFQASVHPVADDKCPSSSGSSDAVINVSHSAAHPSNVRNNLFHVRTRVFLPGRVWDFHPPKFELDRLRWFGGKFTSFDCFLIYYILGNFIE